MYPQMYPLIALDTIGTYQYPQTTKNPTNLGSMGLCVKLSVQAERLRNGGWCPGSDSNRHTLRRGILSPLRLPISPPGQVCIAVCCDTRQGAIITTIDWAVNPLRLFFQHLHKKRGVGTCPQGTGHGRCRNSLSLGCRDWQAFHPSRLAARASYVASPCFYSLCRRFGVCCPTVYCCATD